ncbi:hypothetical protein [Ructibacterium gallinarum]|uniref:Uncharacterized protein n=1 Tax=Ructibacterium gallinarum TaxID=2779355 RepID=A0A9D5M1Z9_9FIRM|nr:hypothetical protein [Ructibacterium gallinarum]MBE5039224.1 hypothetical protein [Ructibacterium gallinarum]
MPNLTTPIPPRLTGQTQQDVKLLKEWGTALIDELTYLFHNLDAGNVSEAASVKAENIDTANAKITNAQIGALTADKLTAGTIDTGKVTVSSSDGCLTLSDSQITISDQNYERFRAAYDKSTGRFDFVLCDKNGVPAVYIGSGGNAVFTGKVESASIFSSTIVGTDSISYTGTTGGVFAQLDPTGIKMMQDQNGVRKQKLGMSVGDDGTAYIVLGAGNGEGSHNINGVVYTNGSFKLEKNDQYASMGLVGYAPFISFWEESGELWLSGQRVLINGIDPMSKIQELESRVQALESM